MIWPAGSMVQLNSRGPRIDPWGASPFVDKKWVNDSGTFVHSVGCKLTKCCRQIKTLKNIFSIQWITLCLLCPFCCFFCQGVLPFHRTRMRKRWIMWTRYSSCGPFVSNMPLLSTPCWVLWQGRPPSLLRKCIIRVQHIKLSIASFRQRDGDFLDALLTLEELFRAFISVAMQPWNNKLSFCAIFLCCPHSPPMPLLHSRWHTHCGDSRLSLQPTHLCPSPSLASYTSLPLLQSFGSIIIVIVKSKGSTLLVLLLLSSSHWIFGSLSLSLIQLKCALLKTLKHFRSL